MLALKSLWTLIHSSEWKNTLSAAADDRRALEDKSSAWALILRTPAVWANKEINKCITKRHTQQNWVPPLKRHQWGRRRLLFCPSVLRPQHGASRWYLKPSGTGRGPVEYRKWTITQLMGIKSRMEDKHACRCKDSAVNKKPVNVQAQTQLRAINH